MRSLGRLLFQHELFQALNPQRMVVEAFNELNLVAAVLFEDVLIFFSDFYNGFKTVSGERRREHKYLFHPFFSAVSNHLVRKRLQPLVVQSRLKKCKQLEWITTM